MALTVCLLLGCHKKQPPASSPAQSSDTPSSAQPQAQPALVGEVDATLTTALRGFVQKNGRMPQSFMEFARGSLDSAPRPPEGKKWAIDASDMTVKAVAK